MKNMTQALRNAQDKAAERIVREVKEELARRQAERRLIERGWELDMNFLAGNQYCGIDPAGELEEEEPRYAWQYRRVFNHIAPAIDTRCAKLASMRPALTVRAASDQESDMRTAKISANVLKAVCEDAGLDAAADKATVWSETCGTAFYKILWDAAAEGAGRNAQSGAVRIASKAFVEAPAEESPDEAALNPEALGAEALNVCYQYKGRYVVTSLKSGLAVIDQYRAHVRVLFDQYLASIRQRQGVSQQVLFPEIIEFTAAEATVLPALLESLRFAGFDLSDLGNDSYAINGLPAGMGNADPAQLVRDIVDRTMETGAEASGKVSEAIAFSLARAAAIRPGKPLSTEEMDHLIASLFACPDSNLTPDGKTIVTIITDEELERRFR